MVLADSCEQKINLLTLGFIPLVELRSRLALLSSE